MNKSAVLSVYLVVLGLILVIPFPLAGIIILLFGIERSIWGLVQIKNTGQGGKYFAWASIVIVSVVVLFLLRLLVHK